ncbi:MAG: hypothetical protein FWG65_05985 [Turicibacter sp.]|nr:hypothetical protein [Turicibacter sp.]
MQNGTYSKTIEFGDITYHLAQKDDQYRIFKAYMSILNYFDETMDVQLSCVNSYISLAELAQNMEIFKRSRNSKYHWEFANIINSQLQKGNNSLIKRKFLTVAVKAKNLKEGKARLERIELDTVNAFGTLEIRAKGLNGAERLALLHKQLNPHIRKNLALPQNWHERNSKDFIAPKSLDFSNTTYCKLGENFCATYFVEVKANQLDDKMLSKILEVNASLAVNIHFKAMEQEKAAQKIKNKLSDIRAKIADIQKRNSGVGVDMSMISPELRENEKEAVSLLNDVTSRDERLFLATILITATAPTKRKLDDIISNLQGIGRQFQKLYPTKKYDIIKT